MGPAKIRAIMKNPLPVFFTVLIVLAGYLHRGERMAAFVMLVIAALLIKRVQRRS
jgi:hypothetical protein